MHRLASIMVVGALVTAGLSGCTWTPRTERGTAVGAATGAVVGAVATKSVGGTAAGAGIGALTGYFLSKNSYRCQKINIFGQPYQGWCLKR